MHRLVFLTFILCAMITGPILAQEGDSSAKPQTEAEDWADDAYERGAYLVKGLGVDTDWPLIWMRVEGELHLMLLDTGAGNLHIIEEKFEGILTPLDAVDTFLDKDIRQRIEPLILSSTTDSEATYSSGISYSFSWKNLGLPDFVEPAISGIVPVFRWEGEIAAIERNQSLGLLAFLPSPVNQPFEQAAVFNIELVDDWAMITEIPLLLGGKDEPEVFKLLIDTGSEGGIDIKKSELPKDILLNHLAEETSVTILGGKEETPTQTTHLSLGSDFIEVSLDAVEGFPEFSDGVEADGIIGSKTLNKFNYVIDAEAGQLILDLSGVDFDDPSAPNNSRIDDIHYRLLPQTMSTADWNGYVVVKPGDWGYQYALQKRDIIYEINGQRVAPSNYDTLGQELYWPDAPIYVCWARPLSAEPSPSDYDTFCHTIDMDANLAPFRQAKAE